MTKWAESGGVLYNYIIIIEPVKGVDACLRLWITALVHVVEDAGQLSLYAEVVERQWKTLAGEKAWFRMFFFLL